MRLSETQVRVPQARLPLARVVAGGTMPSWGPEPELVADGLGNSPNYKRATNPAGAIAFLLGFWQLIAIMMMGIAMIWSAAVFNGP